MVRKLSKANLLHELTERVCRQIGRRVIRQLQNMTDCRISIGNFLGRKNLLGMKNVWEVICFQMQVETSGMWPIFADTVEAVVYGYIAAIQPFERDAIWLCTSQGVNWDADDEERREPYPVNDNDITKYIIHNHIAREAQHWTNRRVRASITRFKELSDGL